MASGRACRAAWREIPLLLPQSLCKPTPLKQPFLADSLIVEGGTVAGARRGQR